MEYTYKQFDYDYREAINYDNTAYYNPPMTINIDGVKYILPFGTSDNRTHKQDGDILLIIGENFGLDYMSLVTIDARNKTIDSCYLDNANTEYHGIFEMELDQQLAILSNYLTH